MTKFNFQEWAEDYINSSSVIMYCDIELMKLIKLMSISMSDDEMLKSEDCDQSTELMIRRGKFMGLKMSGMTYMLMASECDGVPGKMVMMLSAMYYFIKKNNPNTPIDEVHVCMDILITGGFIKKPSDEDLKRLWEKQKYIEGNMEKNGLDRWEWCKDVDIS